MANCCELNPPWQYLHFCAEVLLGYCDGIALHNASQNSDESRWNAPDGKLHRVACEAIELEIKILALGLKVEG